MSGTRRPRPGARIVDLTANRRLLALTAGAVMVLAGLGGAEAARAQSAPPQPPVRQGETLQRQQQQQIEQDQTRILTSPVGQTVIETPTHEKATAAAGSCRDIREITFTRTPHMSAAKRKKLTAPYLNRCLGLGDVENLLSDITRYYIDRSRPTTRVYVRPQNLAAGILALDIVEGRVETVVLAETAKNSLNLRTAFGGVDGQTFNLRTFEQGLDQINRLSSNHATLDILPGSAPGDSIVRIRNEPTSRFHAILSYDDTGQPSTGTRQGSASLIADDVLGLNDLFSYTRRQTLAGEHDTDSQSNSLLFSVPYNRFLLTLGYTDATYKSQAATGTGTVLVLSGDTRDIFGRVDAGVWRDSRSRLDISVTVTGKRNRNYLDDAFLSVSSRTLTVLDLEADFTTAIGRGSLKLGGGWSKGLDALGALDDHRIGAIGDAQRAQFDKLMAHGYLSLPFQVAKIDLSFASDVEAQYAFDALYSSERIVLGSPFTVRGFLRNSLITDHGVYAQNDLSAFLPARLGGQPLIVRPHAGVDAGYAASRTVGAPEGFVAGGALGVGVTWRRFNLDVTTSHEIARGKLPDEGWLTFVRLTAGF